MSNEDVNVDVGDTVPDDTGKRSCFSVLVSLNINVCPVFDVK